MTLAVEPEGEAVQASGHAPMDETLPVSGSADTEARKAPTTAVAGGVARATPRHGLLQAFQSIATLIVVALFLITFTVQPFRIPSSSMEPTLLVGDFLLVDKQVGPRDWLHIFPPVSAIHRGDVIVFHYPVDSSLHLVKRVIGLPGDHLRMRDDHVYIDGKAVNEPYAVYRPAMPDSYRDEFPRMVSADPGVDSRWWIQMHSLVSRGELTVPPDSYFVMGDNRNDSEDSRYWGFVPRAAIVGKAMLVYFSLNEPGEMPDGSQHESAADSLADFARWDRVLHIIR